MWMLRHFCNQQWMCKMRNLFNSNSDDFDSTLVPGTKEDISDTESLAVDDSDEISKSLENLSTLSTKLASINRSETEKSLSDTISILTQMFLADRWKNNIKLENAKSKLINRLIAISDTMTATEIATFLPQIVTAMNDDVNRAMGGVPTSKGFQININNQDIKNTQNNNMVTGNNVYALPENMQPTSQSMSSLSKIHEAIEAFKVMGIPKQSQLSFDPTKSVNSELKSKEVVAEFVELNQKEDKQQNEKMLNEE